MNDRVLTDRDLRTASSQQPDAGEAVAELLAAFGSVEAGAIMFFCSPAQDGTRIGQGLSTAFPGTPIIGCTTAGEFTERGLLSGGVSAVALPTGAVKRAAAALAELDQGIDEGLLLAARQLEQQLGISLREAHWQRYVGFMLVDGVHGSEERVNEVLGDLAPQLNFVGGSAADDMRLKATRVFCGGACSDHGAALLLLDLKVPYVVVKTCSFASTGQHMTITEADAEQRVVRTIDGRPAAEAYAAAIGCTVEELGFEAFMAHPLGLMIDGKPWLRTPQLVTEDRGLKFWCQILAGMDVDVMHATDLVEETRSELRAARDQLGGEASGAVLFNCAFRHLEVQAKGLAEPFASAISEIPNAGFNCYGESWLGHMNQTLTAVVFGR